MKSKKWFKPALCVAMFLAVLLAVGLISKLVFAHRYTKNFPDADSTLAAGSETPDTSALAQAVESAQLASASPAPVSAEESAAASEAPQPSFQATDPTYIRAKAMTAELTLEEKIYQMCFVTPEILTGYGLVTASGEVTKASIDETPVGGVIYFSQNLISTEQTIAMLANIQTYSQDRIGLSLFLGVDEEGGSVARVADSLGTTPLDPMATYGAANDPEQVYEVGRTLASDISQFGFNVDFAPCADVLTNENNTEIGDRSFGSDGPSVAALVAQEVKGLKDGGVLSCPKHFPGHGSTEMDSHDGTSTSARTKEELESSDLLPFKSAIEEGAPMVMVGHMTMTALDGDHPASLSEPIVTGILRDELGYSGIVITDALDMGAITDNYANGEAAVLAIQAGCDMLLCPPSLTDVVDAVASAIDGGTLTEARIDESVTRILAAKLSYDIVS